LFAIDCLTHLDAHFVVPLLYYLAGAMLRRPVVLRLALVVTIFVAHTISVIVFDGVDTAFNTDGVAGCSFIRIGNGVKRTVFIVSQLPVLPQDISNTHKLT